MRFYSALKVISILLLISSCKSCTNNPLKVDVSEIPFELKLKRLDTALFDKDPDSLLTEIPELRKTFGAFFDVYCRSIINIRSVDDTALSVALKSFVTDPDMHAIYADTKKQYTDITFLNKELTAAFKHYKYHFPDSAPPVVVVNFSGLNYAVFTTDSVLAIGLEMFLGAESVYYQMLGLPQYMVRNMNRESLSISAVKGWAYNKFDNAVENKTLLDNMVFNGKILYLLDAMFPEMHDSLKISYKSEQLDWCKANEPSIWAHLLENKLLYTTDHNVLNKYLNEGPFTPGLPRESPGRIGEFTGWMIVKKYMQENPTITVKQLMAEKDAQKILAASKYKPKI